MVRKREIEIQNEDKGKELIDFLTIRYTYHDRLKWTEYIENDRVLINSKSSSPGYILEKGDIVIYLPEPIIEPPINSNYQTLYEDEDILIIDKPADIPCHPGGIYFENTLWFILKQKYDYISLINRLDRETSGVMLIAKNKISAKFYFNKMMERDIQKTYLVLVHGQFPKELDAKGWLTSDVDSVIRKKRIFILDNNAEQPIGEGDPNKQYSYSRFKLLTENGDLSLVECSIITGRTHQIRATVSSLGYPVVGDKIYGLDDSYFFKFINDELTSNDWANLIIKNQALHSYITEIPMLDGSRKIITAQKPSNWPL